MNDGVGEKEKCKQKKHTNTNGAKFIGITFENDIIKCRFDLFHCKIDANFTLSVDICENGIRNGVTNDSCTIYF